MLLKTGQRDRGSAETPEERYRSERMQQGLLLYLAASLVSSTLVLVRGIARAVWVSSDPAQE